MAVQKVQSISCDNDAGIVMSFSVAYTDDNTGDTLTYGDSGSYPIDQARTIDVGPSGLPEGTWIWARVWPTGEIGGQYVDADRKVKYYNNGNTATYQVTGVIDD